jgi:hypothetical protein
MAKETIDTKLALLKKVTVYLSSKNQTQFQVLIYWNNGVAFESNDVSNTDDLYTVHILTSIS